MPYILVVDANDNHRALIEQELSDDGFDVTAVGSASEALSHITKKQPDLVVTDIVLPRLNGICLIQDIMRLNPAIPIIIHSGHASFQEIFMAWAASEFVLKSGDFSELKGAVNRLLLKPALNRVY